MNPRLVIGPASSAAREIGLATGISRIGRNADNDLAIADPSVSRYHCEISIEPTGCKVRDMNSSNGTFLDGLPIQDARIEHGQRLRLGSVDCLFLLDESAPRAPAPTQIPLPPPIAVPLDPAPSAPGMCEFHPGEIADWICPRFGYELCRACVEPPRAGHSIHPTCRRCQSVCHRIRPSALPPATASGSFWQDVAGSFAYPLQKQGAVFLFSGALFLSLIDAAGFLASYASLLGLLALLILAIFNFGFLFAYMKSVIAVSSNGDDTLPGWPEITDFWGDLGGPFLQFLALHILFLGPGFVLIRQDYAIAGWTVAGIGMLLLPMGFLAVALTDSLAGLNPVAIVSWVFRVPGPYLVASFFFLSMYGLRYGCEWLIPQIPVPFLPGLLFNFILLYGLTVQMRVLGRMYYRYRHRFV